MFEMIVVILMLVIVIQLFALNKAIRGVSRGLLELSTNPLRHQVKVESELSERIGVIEDKMDDISDEVTTIRRNFISDEEKTELWIEHVTRKGTE